MSFSSAIVDQAAGLLRGIGIENAGTVLAPLVRSSVEAALARSGASTIDVADLLADTGGGFDNPPASEE